MITQVTKVIHASEVTSDSITIDWGEEMVYEGVIVEGPNKFTKMTKKGIGVYLSHTIVDQEGQFIELMTKVKEDWTALTIMGLSGWMPPMIKVIVYISVEEKQ